MENQLHSFQPAAQPKINAQYGYAIVRVLEG